MSDEEWSKALEGIPSHIGYQSKYKSFPGNTSRQWSHFNDHCFTGLRFLLFSLHQSSISACLRILTRTALTIALCMCLVFHQKERHKILRHQLQVMYFLPTIVAMIHFAVAMTALRFY